MIVICGDTKATADLRALLDCVVEGESERNVEQKKNRLAHFIHFFDMFLKPSCLCVCFIKCKYFYYIMATGLLYFRKQFHSILSLYSCVTSTFLVIDMQSYLITLQHDLCIK